MEMEWGLILFAGAAGGVLRGLIGYVKYLTSFKNVAFQWKYFFGMAFLSAVVGMLAVWAARDLGISLFDFEVLRPSLAFIIGYAGGDFIENLFKIVMRRPNLYLSLPEVKK